MLEVVAMSADLLIESLISGSEQINSYSKNNVMTGMKTKTVQQFNPMSDTEGIQNF